LQNICRGDDSGLQQQNAADKSAGLSSLEAVGCAALSYHFGRTKVEVYQTEHINEAEL